MISLEDRKEKRKEKKKKSRQKKRKLAAECREKDLEEEELPKTELEKKKKVYSVWPSSWPQNDNLIKETILDTEIKPFTTSSSLQFLYQNIENEFETKQTEEKVLSPIEQKKTPIELMLEENKKNFKRMGEKETSIEKSIPPKKQHSGLRCKKCFVLLARDTDFEFRNGKLYIKPGVLKDKTWEGMIVEKGKVFCQNMHNVGFMEPTTWTNKTIYLPTLKTEHTTFIENFVNNPKYADSDIIKNKGLFASEIDFTLEDPASDPWYKLKMLDGWTKEKQISDRYH